MCAGEVSQGNVGGVNLVMRDVVSYSVCKARVCFVLPQQLFPAPAPGRPRTAGSHPAHLAGFCCAHRGKTRVWLLRQTDGGTSHRSLSVGCICLRMGYPITRLAKLIAEYLSRVVLKFFLTSGMPLERAAACAWCSGPSFCKCWWLSEPQLKCCNRMFTYLFQGTKKKKKKNNAKGKHQQENSMFFVMLFLRGHLLLAIRLNHWNLPWSYICHWLHFPTSVIN